MHVRIALIAACAVYAAPITAQTRGLSRSDAIQLAIEHGARIAVARADTSVASAGLTVAATLPNPALTASYSKSVPNYHTSLDIPVDFPWLRRLRVRAASLGLQASELRLQLARATVALDADTTYTHAIAARDRLVISHRNALDADSLLRIVQRRRDAGDASDMDVELARVNVGRDENVAAGDSLTLVSSLLDLQATLGIASERLEIQATDSLVDPPAAAVPKQTLSEAAAGMSFQSATLNAQFQRRSLWLSPSLSLGFEFKDPDQPGLLPTFGVGLAIPLFNRNRGQIEEAEAERERASAELTLAQIEARNAIAHAQRERENALARVVRDRQVVASAARVSTMSLTAYREGAASLTSVLDAQRTARDVLIQYIDDLAAAWIATAELRVLAISPVPSSKP